MTPLNRLRHHHRRGPVGLFVANLMDRAGYRFVLLERNEGLFPLLAVAPYPLPHRSPSL